MDARIKKLWVDALRSGEYEQGERRLNNKGLFCCLGVLCEVAIKDGLPLKLDINISDGSVTYGGAAATLPRSVVQWSGLADDWGTFKIDSGARTLTSLNDGGETFPAIAKTIERYF